MDKKDEKIIEILKENGRASYTEIAERVKVTEATVRNRINRMEQEGTIKGYSVQLSEEIYVKAFLLVKTDTGIDIEKVVDSLPENMNVYELAGRYDIILRIKEEKTSGLNRKVDAVRAIEGVEETETFMVLEES